MPAFTPNRAYPYPVPGDPVDVTGDLQRLAEAIDNDLETIVPQIQPRPCAQARRGSPLTVGSDVIQTFIAFDTVDFDTAGFFNLPTDPVTMRLIQGSVYFIWASIRFPAFTNAAGDAMCRLEIINPTSSGTAVLDDNAYTEENNQGFVPNLVSASATWVVNTTVFDEFRVSVRHNSDTGAKVFTDASFGAFRTGVL